MDMTRIETATATKLVGAEDCFNAYMKLELTRRDVVLAQAAMAFGFMHLEMHPRDSAKRPEKLVRQKLTDKLRGAGDSRSTAFDVTKDAVALHAFFVKSYGKPDGASVHTFWQGVREAGSAEALAEIVLPAMRHAGMETQRAMRDILHPKAAAAEAAREEKADARAELQAKADDGDKKAAAKIKREQKKEKAERRAAWMETVGTALASPEKLSSAEVMKLILDAMAARPDLDFAELHRMAYARRDTIRDAVAQAQAA